MICLLSLDSHNCRMKKAFSLVELSIVLVILGLLTGGILAGQSLIRAAELRSVSTEFQRYQTSVMTFRDKYFALPGDMKNATAFWGELASGVPCRDVFSTSTATCNGDGDGQIESMNTGGTGTGMNEVFHFWLHLANAGLIEGSYTGHPQAGNPWDEDSDFGVNAPASKLSDAGWHAEWFGSSATSVEGVYFAGSYGNSFAFGAAPANYPRNPAIKIEEAWNLDAKMDDGMPGTGAVRATWAYGCTDGSSSGTVLTVPYRLSIDQELCALVFPNAF